MSIASYAREYIPTVEAYGWTGAPTFDTRIITKANGRERRNANWSQPQFEFSLPFQGLTQEQYAPIANMFFNRMGAWGVFLYRNRLDFHMQQEVFAVAQAGQTEFQLVKRAVVDGIDFQRKVQALYEPDPSDPGRKAARESPMVIRVNGSPTTAYTANFDTGEIVFDAAFSGGEVLDATLNFSHWVRFSSDKLPFTIINKSSGRYVVEGRIELLEVPPPEPIGSPI